MKLSQHLRLGLLGAVTVASLLGGTGIADATAYPATSPGTVTVPAPGQPDVGVPPEGVFPDAPVTAPDGSKISATSPGAFGKWRTHKHGVAGQSTRIAADGRHAEAVPGARIRAWAPNGTVLGIAQHGKPGGEAGCKIPGRDGYLWGWVGFRTTGNNKWTSGWMRADLFRVWYGYFWDDLRHLPWC
ncbi:MAG TPA: hypothetical protein VFG15_03585 [Amycolatopsis sp.]|nr:hypothetical protein [Amycolatopsis sp.]